ncbi:MAG: hypothetical protein Q8Q09_24635, partial [Deltaproteobacteria bacterium]|nr:hypothetical protein [Deltaproteobacteria bacterium]
MSSEERMPGPRSKWGQLRHASDPFPWMDELARDYSDPVRVPMLVGDDLVVAWSPEHLKSIFAADPDTFVPGTHEALAL